MWENRGDRLSREFVFRDFSDAIAFMVRVAFEAERMDHHPEWRNCHRRVMVELTSHDSGGITDRDHALAARMDGIFRTFPDGADSG